MLLVLFSATNGTDKADSSKVDFKIKKIVLTKPKLASALTANNSATSPNQPTASNQVLYHDLKRYCFDESIIETDYQTA